MGNKKGIINTWFKVSNPAQELHILLFIQVETFQHITAVKLEGWLKEDTQGKQ